MLTKEQKIEKIYEKIADKKWTFWCKFYHKSDEYKKEKMIVKAIPHLSSSSEYIENWQIISPSIQTSDIRKWIFSYLYWWELKFGDTETRQDYILESIYTIWHDVMYWDIIDYIEENNLRNIRVDEIAPNLLVSTFDDLHDLYEYKRKPIQEQSKDCIDLVFNILELWLKENS